MKEAQIQDAVCIECREGITNPICPDCLADSIKAWLRDKVPSLADELVTPRFETGVKCIKCGNKMGICAHCYVNDVYDYFWNLTPMLATDFINTFNFEHA